MPGRRSQDAQFTTDSELSPTAPHRSRRLHPTHPKPAELFLLRTGHLGGPGACAMWPLSQPGGSARRAWVFRNLRCAISAHLAVRAWDSPSFQPSVPGFDHPPLSLCLSSRNCPGRCSGRDLKAGWPGSWQPHISRPGEELYPQPVSIGRTLPGLRGPGVTTRVASEQVFLAEDALQLPVEVRSPTPSRRAWEPATCFALRCLCLAARRDSLSSGALGVASQKTARNMQAVGRVFLFRRLLLV